MGRAGEENAPGSSSWIMSLLPAQSSSGMCKYKTTSKLEQMYLGAPSSKG